MSVCVVACYNVKYRSVKSSQQFEVEDNADENNADNKNNCNIHDSNDKDDENNACNIVTVKDNATVYWQ